MATVVFNISKRVDDLGKSELLVRFCASRENIYRAKSGIYVPVNRWSKKGTVIIPKIETPERQELLKLDEYILNLKRYILKSYEEADQSLVSKDWLTECILRFTHPDKFINHNTENDLFFYFRQYLKQKRFSDTRLRAIEVVFRMLQRYELFMKTKNKKFMLTLTYFNKDTLHHFEDYLRNEQEYLSISNQIVKKITKSRTPKLRGNNTISTKMRILRAFFNWCKLNELITKSPFEKYSIDSETYGTPYYISIEERNKIYELDLSADPELAIQRDVFIFQCLIGCRVSDLLNLKKSNIINGAIEYIASKTSEGNPVTVRVPLNSTAKEIVDRYANCMHDSLLPFPDSIKYNVSIKKIFTLAGITRNVTILNTLTRKQVQVPINTVASSHLARRTFIGNLYKQVKDPNLVGSLSGHREGSKAFARYRDIDDDIKSELVNLLL